MTTTFEKLPDTRRAEILDAAAKVFARDGYYQASVADICAAAGISNGALYKYFENKSDLYEAVMRRMADLMLARAAPYADTDRPVWALLRQAMEEAILFLREYRDYFVIYMDMGSPSMDSFASVLSEEVEAWSLELFSSIVERAKRRGEIRPEIDTRTAAYMIDNHFMLFGFSCVSEHYNRRLQQYLGTGDRRMTDVEKMSRLLRSFEQLLGRR